MELHPRAKKIAKTYGRRGDQLIAKCDVRGYQEYAGHEVYLLRELVNKLADEIDRLEKQHMENRKLKKWLKEATDAWAMFLEEYCHRPECSCESCETVNEIKAFLKENM